MSDSGPVTSAAVPGPLKRVRVTKAIFMKGTTKRGRRATLRRGVKASRRRSR